MCRRKPLNIVSLVASLFTQKQFFSGTNMFIFHQTEQQTHFGCAWHGVESLLKLEFTWSWHLFGLLHFVLWYELWAISAGSLCLVYALNLVKPVNFPNLTTFSLVLWKRRVTVSPYLFKMPREVFTHPHFLNKFLICIYSGFLFLFWLFFFIQCFLLITVDIQVECEELAKHVETLKEENSSLRDDLEHMREECEKLAAENASLIVSFAMCPWLYFPLMPLFIYHF